MAPIFYGTITAHPSQRAMLESFGITLGGYDPANGVFLARADDAAVNALTEFKVDFPHALYGRTVDSADMQLRPGMSIADLRAESAFVGFCGVRDGAARARYWRTADRAVQAMLDALTRARSPSDMTLTGDTVVTLMRLSGKTIDTLASAMGITKTRVRAVREKGVTGEGYVLDWVEAISAVESIEQTQSDALQTFLARLDSDLLRHHVEHAGQCAPLTDAERVEAMQIRHGFYMVAVNAAKVGAYEACGKDIAARLALMRLPDTELLRPLELMDWVLLEGNEYCKVTDPRAREDAASVLTSIMRTAPEFCTVFHEEWSQLTKRVRVHTDRAALRELMREARKSGEENIATRAPDPVAEYVVLTNTGGTQRKVATFHDATEAARAFNAAEGKQRPYLLVNGDVVLYTDSVFHLLSVATTPPVALQQALAQRDDNSDAALGNALRDGIRRTAAVIFSRRDGVYLGMEDGLPRFSGWARTDSEAAVPTFMTRESAKVFAKEWESEPGLKDLLNDLHYVCVEPEEAGHATLQACARAGMQVLPRQSRATNPPAIHDLMP